MKQLILLSMILYLLVSPRLFADNQTSNQPENKSEPESSSQLATSQKISKSQITEDPLHEYKLKKRCCNCTDQLVYQEEQYGEICYGGGPVFFKQDYKKTLLVSVNVGEELRYVITPLNLACRHKWKNVEFKFSGLPKGAIVNVSPKDATAEIIWTPNSKNIGTHLATVKVKAEGYEWSETTLTIDTVNEWTSFFMPGVQYTLWLPHEKKQFGTVQGVSIQYLIATWMSQNSGHGPATGRVYMDIDLLRSSLHSQLGVAYSLGAEFSFESCPARNFLIPFFGIEIGGVYQKSKNSDAIHTAQVTPLGGLNLWVIQNFSINISTGYMIPFSHIDELRGFRMKTGINFSFW